MIHLLQKDTFRFIKIFVQDSFIGNSIVHLNIFLRLDMKCCARVDENAQNLVANSSNSSRKLIERRIYYLSLELHSQICT
jgi:hypothetical protein